MITYDNSRREYEQLKGTHAEGEGDSYHNNEMAVMMEVIVGGGGGDWWGLMVNTGDRWRLVVVCVCGGGGC